MVTSQITRRARPGGSVTDDEAEARRAAATDVQGLKTLGVLDLVVAGRVGYLLVAVEHLAHPGGTDRVTGADQTAARVDRMLAVDLEPTFFHGLPALAGLGDAEVVDGHVLAGREAVVGLDALDAIHVGDAGALPGISHGAAHVGQHVLGALALSDLVHEAQA